MRIYTIGQSNHSIDRFLELLEISHVSTLVDVRSIPFSRFNPQFNKRNLQSQLANQGVEYLFMGDSLGGRPSDPACYVHQAIPPDSKDYAQELIYDEVMKRAWFIEGINQLLALAEQKVTCIMCSEHYPPDCHRHHLIAMYLIQHHPVTVLHILRDKTIVDARAVPMIGK